MEVLILAMTKMRSGICTAGFSLEKHPLSGLRWVRPVKEFGSLLLGDMRTAEGCVIECGDVVDLCLQTPRPDPPHCEDWVCEFIRPRPRKLRSLEGDKRAGFFHKYLDHAPDDVLVHHQRSLCLVRPDDLTARFSLDSYSGKFKASMNVMLNGCEYRNLAVTDIKWRALGRSWLGEGGSLELSWAALAERMEIHEVYLVLGLSRGFQDKWWTLVVGVHMVPDFTVVVNYGML